MRWFLKACIGIGLSASSVLAADAVNPLDAVQVSSAPAWVKPGVRLTYYCQSGQASANLAIPQQDDQFADPPEPRAGTGFTETDILAVHGDTIAYESRGFTIMPGHFALAPSAGGVGNAAHFGDTWIHPSQLAKIPDSNNDGVSVYRQSWKIGERTYQAICTATKKQNSSSFTVYDLKTGVLLHSSSNSPIDGNRLLTQATLVQMRQLNIPWMNAALPAELTHTNQLRFDGSIVTNAGGYGTNWPIQWQASIHDPTADYLPCREITSSPNSPAPAQASEHILGINSLLPIALPRGIMSKLHDGQVLDRDPITKYTVVVHTMASRGGQSLIALQESSGAENPSTVNTYDATTGRLIAVRIASPATYTAINLSLAGGM